MGTIFLKDYGNVISDKNISSRILENLQSVLRANGEVTVDFTDVLTMATFCARQIFGKLYTDFGRENFIKKVSLVNANDTIKAIVSDAIKFSVENTPKN